MKEVWYRLAGCVAIAGAFAVAQPELGRAQTPVRDIHNPERRPFQVELQRQVRIPVAAGRESIQVVDVPAGARLVIEHISFHAGSADAVTPGSHQTRFQLFASLVTKADTVAANHELLITRTDFGVSSSNTASQPIRVYADGGTPVSVRIGGRAEDDRSTVVSVNLSISGHLVDLP
jgi:hypothetical protein